jgi:hypothetical protein
MWACVPMAGRDGGLSFGAIRWLATSYKVISVGHGDAEG